MSTPACQFYYLGSNSNFLEVLLGILGGWLPLGRLWHVGQPKKFTIVWPWSTKNVLDEPPWSPLGSILGSSWAHFDALWMILVDNMDL